MSKPTCGIWIQDTTTTRWIIKPNILKIGPNEPVQLVEPGTGVESSPIDLSKLLVGQNQSKTRLNRSKSFEPKNRSQFCNTAWFKKCIESIIF